VPLTRERPPPREISPARARCSRVRFASRKKKGPADICRHGGGGGGGGASRVIVHLRKCWRGACERAIRSEPPNPRRRGSQVGTAVPKNARERRGGRGRRAGVAPLSRTPSSRAAKYRGSRDARREGGREEGGDEGKAWWEGGSGNGGSGREFARGAEKSRTCGLYPRMIPRLSRAEFNVLSGSAPESRGRQAGRRAATRPLRHTYTHTYTHIHIQRHTYTHVHAVHGRTRFREIAHGRPLAPPLRTPRGYTGCPAPTRRLLSHSAEGTRKGFVEKQEGHAGCFVSRPGGLPDSCPS